MHSEQIKAIESCLDRLILNQPLGDAGLGEEFSGVLQRMSALRTMHTQLQEFAVKLTDGDMDAPPPPRTNYLAGGLKQLQSQLRHLTWQAQCVAQGDYNQRVDFMGQFSTAFNHMVTQLESRESGLRRQQRAMEQVFDTIESIIIADPKDKSKILYANQRARQRFGIGKGPSGPLPNGGLDSVLGLCSRRGTQQVYDHQQDRWYSVSVFPVHWGDQTDARLYHCQDITRHKRREKQLQFNAMTDVLTGIHNRRSFELMLAREWNSCMRVQKPISLILFDIDYFKLFNDQYGHVNGDLALAAFAKILCENFGRADDVVARFGGEEFVVILPHTDQSGAISLAQKVCEITAGTEIVVKDACGDLIPTRITVSGGICTAIPNEPYSPHQMVMAADGALYASKNQGRNRINCAELENACPI